MLSPERCPPELALASFEHPHRSRSEGTFLVGGPVLSQPHRWIPAEEEAVDLFRDAARNASLIVEGHTLMAQFLAAGEYGLAAPNYAVNHRRLQSEGAPIKWEPPVEPIVLRTDGITIHRDTTRPATALLMLEFILTDAQALLPGLGRIPVSTSVEGGLPAEYEAIPLPVEVIRQRDKWESLYEQVLLEGGKGPVSS